MIKLKRSYDLAEPGDGRRFLVERLWPRGIKKASLVLDGWLKDVAPSAELRKWFSHDPQKWQKFRWGYFAELNRNPDNYKPILSAARRGTVTLIYSSRDIEHNAARALKEYLEIVMAKDRAASTKSAVTDFRLRNTGKPTKGQSLRGRK